MEPTVEVRQFGKQALRELDEEMNGLQVKWAEASAKKTAWLVILGEEEPIAGSTSDTVNTPASPTAPPTQDMTEAAREIIARSSEAGFGPKDITERLRKKGFNVASGFSSNLLFRLKKRSEIVEHGGRYYLPIHDPKPRLQMNTLKDQGATEVTP